MFLKEKEEYDMNSLTMAILPMEFGSKLYSHIYQFDGEYYSSLKPLDIIKKSCRLNGSSYEGRKEGTRQLTEFTHKIPLAINSSNLMYFFPTASPTISSCAWISHEHIGRYERVDSKSTLVFFRNKQSIVLPLSVNSFHKQVLRTAFLRAKVQQRIVYNTRKIVFSHPGFPKAKSDSFKASEHKSYYKYGAKEPHF